MPLGDDDVVKKVVTEVEEDVVSDNESDSKQVPNITALLEMPTQASEVGPQSSRPHVAPPSEINRAPRVRDTSPVRPGVVQVRGIAPTHDAIYDREELERATTRESQGSRSQAAVPSLDYVASAQLVDENAELQARRRVLELEEEVRRLQGLEGGIARVDLVENERHSLQQQQTSVLATSVTALDPLPEDKGENYESPPSSSPRRKVMLYTGIVCLILILIAVAGGSGAALASSNDGSSSGGSNAGLNLLVPTSSPVRPPASEGDDDDIVPTTSPIRQPASESDDDDKEDVVPTTSPTQKPAFRDDEKDIPTAPPTTQLVSGDGEIALPTMSPTRQPTSGDEDEEDEGDDDAIHQNATVDMISPMAAPTEPPFSLSFAP